MARISRRLPAKLLILGVSLTLLTVAADRSGLLEAPENLLYDSRAKNCQYFAPPPSPDIVHLDIDDASIEIIGSWPWPRSVFADMMDEVALAGPKAVLFDILFTDQARPEWKPETSADGTTGYVKIDHDAMLAASFRRMGNALIPVHLHIGDPPPISSLELEVRQVLRKDLECGDQQVAQAVPQHGASDTDWLEAFLSARRFVARERVLEAWDRINPADAIDAGDPTETPAQVGGAPDPPAPSWAPGATTQTTQTPQTPSTRPAALADLAMTLPSAGSLERQIIVQLLPHTDLTISSPLLRAVDDAFRRVRAMRVLRRFTFPIPPGLPQLIRPSDTALPIPRLSDAAAGTAFVDYPDSRDGKVRSIPLMLEYDGRMYPQMGLMLASMMLGVSPREFRYTPDLITIPMAGKPDGKGGVWRRDIAIPIETYRSSLLKEPIPTYFDIPWFGGAEWQAMYDPAHRLQKQHMSIIAVHDACETRRRIETANRKIDSFLQIVLSATNEGSIRSFLEHPPSPQAPLSRREIVASTFKVLTGLGIPLDKSPDDKDITEESDRLLFRAIKALRDADQESVHLSGQLADHRQFLRTQLQNKGVLIGVVATGMDLKPTSIHYAAPGVIIHGTLVNAILTGRMWREVPGWVTALVTLAAGFLTTAIVARLTPALAFFSSGAMAVIYLLLNGLVLFDYGNLVVGAAGPLIAVAAVWSGCTLVRLLVERIERARITKRFSTYVDPSLVDWVLAHPEQTRFDGETREMSMAFSDLVGFTSLTEKMGERAIPLLAEYMGQMIPAIRARKGFIGCLMGDGIYFFYGAPQPDPDHAIHAVQSVCAMQAKLDTLNASFQERGLPPLGMRVGVTSGHVIIGDAGPPERSDYTALGDVVNLAARLETANKAFGTNSLVSARTVELLNGSYLVRPVANLRVAGKTQGVVVYEPLCHVDLATPEQRGLVECTEQVVGAFQRADFDACIKAADRLEHEMGRSKKLAALYRQLARQHLADRPEDFDGQVVLTVK